MSFWIHAFAKWINVNVVYYQSSFTINTADWLFENTPLWLGLYSNMIFLLFNLLVISLWNCQTDYWHQGVRVDVKRWRDENRHKYLFSVAHVIGEGIVYANRISTTAAYVAISNRLGLAHYKFIWSRAHLVSSSLSRTTQPCSTCVTRLLNFSGHPWRGCCCCCWHSLSISMAIQQ